MNSLPLSNSYEVLRIDENDFAENENHDTTHSLNTLPLSLPPSWKRLEEKEALGKIGGGGLFFWFLEIRHDATQKKNLDVFIFPL